MTTTRAHALPFLVTPGATVAQMALCLDPCRSRAIDCSLSSMRLSAWTLLKLLHFNATTNTLDFETVSMNEPLTITLETCRTMCASQATQSGCASSASCQWCPDSATCGAQCDVCPATVDGQAVPRVYFDEADNLHFDNPTKKIFVDGVDVLQAIQNLSAKVAQLENFTVPAAEVVGL
eukprot:m.411145 g.411145  ORF g.411145 m.411145 type:complete len:178 (+) comp20162_c1_seq2:850-1383(+)